jgi:hypothetical protein
LVGQISSIRGAAVRREKRSAIIRARVTPSMREQLELDLRERSTVLSISDYLFELVEERLQLRAIKVTKQQLGRRIGNE